MGEVLARAGKRENAFSTAGLAEAVLAWAGLGMEWSTPGGRDSGRSGL